MDTTGMSANVIAFQIAQINGAVGGGEGEYAVLAEGPGVQLGELRGLPQDCPSISPQISSHYCLFTHLLSQLRPPDSANLVWGNRA